MVHFLKPAPSSLGKTVISFTCIAGLSLMGAIPALAGYNPPQDASAPSSGSRTSTGVRRGCLADAGAMIIFAPHSYVGQTGSTRPTVSWFIPDQESFAMELRLYELARDGNRTLLEKLDLATTPGLMQASLPVTQPPLEPGKQYLWQVVVLCNPNRPSSALVDEVVMEVVPLAAELEASLALATSPQERANLFAEGGLWYDALAQVAEAQTPEAVAYRDLLLQDLAEVERNSSYGQALREQMQNF
jgi:hypothetical protein